MGWSLVERELMMTGIGGQAVQPAAQTLARAAVAEALEVTATRSGVLA
jgi:Pyruvate/2-oxoacid:ferredoxin oxidoreductase gamma subunit